AGARSARLIHQAGRALLVELLLPGVERMLGESDERGEVAGRQAGALPGVENQQPLFGRERRARRFVASHEASSLARSGEGFSPACPVGRPFGQAAIPFFLLRLTYRFCLRRVILPNRLAIQPPLVVRCALGELIGWDGFAVTGRRIECA